MYQWKCDFSVDGRRTVQIVSARGFTDAKKLIEAQYPHSRIMWYSVTQVK